jgi:hypothetical protein
MVIDFMNADFAHASVKRGKWASYLLDAGLSLKQARAMQERVLAAHGGGDVALLVHDVDTYVSAVTWKPSKTNRRTFTMLADTSRAESILYVSLVNVVNGGQFWSLKRCAECSRFFPDGRKRQYCSDACLRRHNSKTAQARVEKARRKKRFDEVYPELLRLQSMAKRLPFSEMLDKLPSFDPKLLAIIIEGKKPLKELASQVKYKNRKILMEAKFATRKGGEK